MKTKFMNTAHFLLYLVSHSFPSDPETTSADDLIMKYFTEGHSYEVIRDFLAAKHNISVSLSTLKRRLQSVGLTRRTKYTPIVTVQAAISDELKGSGQLLGYRAMWQTLKQKYSLRRGDVMRLMGELDPVKLPALSEILASSKPSTCMLDPIPTKLFKECSL
ncbi:hypothetical protein GOODEAATRI_008941 [Goodea atripinnis]|uniref:Clr5 domain-containing protein n=1 Tax=Goodea atripinnis TaxID=208336 RepID=A0ABV0MG88_9TELE